jgi:hypothetical protein
VLEAPGDIPSLSARVLDALAGTFHCHDALLYVHQDLLSHRGRVHSALGRLSDRGGKLDRVCGKLIYSRCALGDMRSLELDQRADLFEHLAVPLLHKRAK